MTILIIYLFIGLVVALHLRAQIGDMPLTMWLLLILLGPVGLGVMLLERLKI